MRFQSYIYFLRGSFLLCMPGFPVEGNWDAGRATKQPGSHLDRGPGSVLTACCRLLLIQANLWSVGLNSQVGICSSTGKRHRGLQSRRRWKLVSEWWSRSILCCPKAHATSPREQPVWVKWTLFLCSPLPCNRRVKETSDLPHFLSCLLGFVIRIKGRGGQWKEKPVVLCSSVWLTEQLPSQRWRCCCSTSFPSHNTEEHESLQIMLMKEPPQSSSWSTSISRSSL